MDTSVRDELLERDLGHLAADRVEPRDDHRFGGIVDDELHAGLLLERADVPAFLADDLALDVVRRDLHGRRRELGHMRTGILLDDGRHDVERPILERLHAVLAGLLAGILGGDLGGVGRRLAAALEAHHAG